MVYFCIFCKKQIPDNDRVFHTVNCGKGYQLKAQKTKRSYSRGISQNNGN